MRDAYTDAITQKLRLNLMSITIGDFKNVIDVKLNNDSNKIYPVKIITLTKESK